MSITPLNLLKVAFAIWVTWSCVKYLRSGRLRRDFTIFARLDAKKWAGLVVSNLLVLAAVLTVGVTLIVVEPQVLGFSWLRLLHTAADGPADPGGNLNVAAAQVPVVGIAFLLLLFVNLPRLARAEENQFRRGTRDWRDAVPRSIKFGLAHCIIGVPIGVGLALSIGGLWFTYHYFRGGVRRATQFHAVYNMMIVLLLLSWLIFAG